MAFLTAIILLPVICAEYQELKLIRQLNDFYGFDHNVVLLDKLVDTGHFISKGRQDDFTPQTVYVFDNTVDSILRFNTLKTIESKITLLIVGIGDTEFDRIINLLNQVKAIQRLQINMKIGVFFSYIHEPTTGSSGDDNIRKLFDWSWKNKIVNIFAATNALSDFTDGSRRPESIFNIFTYIPFGTFSVRNLTGSEAYENFFISQSSNLKGHPVRLGAPFHYYNNEQLWLAVFRVMNVSFVVVENTYNSLSEYFENGIDFVPRIFFNEEAVEVTMYPIDMIPMVILVPEALPFFDFGVYVRTVIVSDDFFDYSSITIVATMLLLTIFRYIQQKKILFFQSVADVLNLLMNDNGYIKYQRLSIVEVFLIVPLTFMGFVLVNGILSNLISYLTKPILEPQIDSVDDMYRSENHIFVWSEHWKCKITKMLADQSNHSDWNEKVIVLDGKVLFQQFTLYNRSVSFLEDLKYAKCLLRIQKRLDIKGYHIPNARMYKYLLSYPINREFPFTERFNEIVQWILSAGLYDLWLREAISSFEKDVVNKNLELLKDRQEPDIDRFPVPMFIAYGWVASIIVFVMEIVWKKLLKR